MQTLNPDQAPPTFSVLVHKATRGPQLVKAGLDLAAAIAAATTLYEASRTLFITGLARSGVATLVAQDDAAQALLQADNRTPLDRRVVRFQAGSY